MLHRHTSRRRRTLMARGLIATLATASLIAAATQAAPSQAAPAVPRDNKHVLQNGGKALTHHAGKSDLATVKHFLRSKGANGATLRPLKASGPTWTFRGVTHQRYAQRVSGLRVYDAEAKAAFNAKGQLIHFIDFITPVGKGKAIRPATKGSDAALRAAVKSLYPARTVMTRKTGRAAGTTTFAKGQKYLTGPRVQRVAVPTGGGRFAVGYTVETWDAASNDLYSTLVTGRGRVVSHELRTARDDYNVFTEDPEKTPQTVVPGPGDGNEESPLGWLFDA